MCMKKICMLCLTLLYLTSVQADEKIVSPNGKVILTLSMDQGQPSYQVAYDGQTVIVPSVLGLVTNIGDYSQGLVQKAVETKDVKETYSLRNIKQSHVNYEATEAVATYEQDGQTVMDIIFRVSNRDVAFRYKIYPKKEARVCVVERETSSFVLSAVEADGWFRSYLSKL